MDYLEAAALLGQAIVDSSEFQEFKSAENTLLSDEKAQKILLEHNQIQGQIVNAAKDNKIDAAGIEAMKEAMLEKKRELDSYEVTKNYFNAKQNFDRMMGEVNSVLERFMAGESDCSGSCDSCGGC